jgi:hypothetical protein
MIQQHLEHGIAELKLKDTDGLYELYKEVRIPMATNGMITVQGSHKCLTNPKSIAAGLCYIWIVINGENLTQEDCAHAFHIGKPTIAKSKRIILRYFQDNNIELPHTEFQEFWRN